MGFTLEKEGGNGMESKLEDGLISDRSASGSCFFLFFLWKRLVCSLSRSSSLSLSLLFLRFLILESSVVQLLSSGLVAVHLHPFTLTCQEAMC